MLAMEMPFFGHLRGVGGRCWAIGPITPQTTTRRPRSPDLAGCGLVGWWRGSAMQAMREKKPQAMRAMGGGEGANPPQNRTTAPRYPPRRTPAILAGAGGGWVVAGGPDWLAVPRFGQSFFSLAGPIFFFFLRNPTPCPHTLGGYFPDFFSDSPDRIQCGQWALKKYAGNFLPENSCQSCRSETLLKHCSA